MEPKYIKTVKRIFNDSFISIPEIISDVFERIIIELMKEYYLGIIIKYKIEKVECYWDPEANFDGDVLQGFGAIEISFIGSDKTFKIDVDGQGCWDTYYITISNEGIENCLITIKNNEELNEKITDALLSFQSELLSHRNIVSYYKSTLI